MTDYTKYKGRDLTLWEKFFPPEDYDCGCGSDPYCVCGWGTGVIMFAIAGMGGALVLWASFK